ncbi:MAG TPA: hypothetical protein HPP77_08225 [Candidatus Hydrogenedentes bacterium]|nr:hypothetical protein [Candidatus Hydrogenedentota bacterium]
MADMVLSLQSPTTSCSGYTTTDAEGRFSWFGIPPNQTCVVRALDPTDDYVLGTSEPFTGEPGETLAEVLIVCGAKGGIEGIFSDAEGRPVPNIHLGCWLRMADGTLKGVPGANTDANGRFVLTEVSPDGFYSEVLIACKRSESLEMAFLRDIEIVADAIADLGVIVARPLSADEEAVLFPKSD